MSTLEDGGRVGRYRIVRFLGAGAMGEVYLAEDPHIERKLAIKTVRLAGGRPSDIEDRKRRLLREARAAGRLLHPNVVTLFDTGEESGLLYLAFEYVEGSDLASRIEQGPAPSLREALRLIRQVADALDYAHRQGIVHRDIKPSNILLDTTGRVKVADFGIAKVAGQNTELTVVGSVMGSPQYLSPEQIRGEELDGRSDIFSLGVVLYELLSGRRPFDGETITTLVYQILHKDPSISDLRAVPPRIEQLLHRMLAKDREERLATAAQVAEEIAAIERELPEELLSAPAASVTQQLDATRILPSRSLPPAGAPGAPPPATAAAPRAPQSSGAMPGPAAGMTGAAAPGQPPAPVPSQAGAPALAPHQSSASALAPAQATATALAPNQPGANALAPRPSASASGPAARTWIAILVVIALLALAVLAAGFYAFRGLFQAAKPETRQAQQEAGQPDQTAPAPAQAGSTQPQAAPGTPRPGQPVRPAEPVQVPAAGDRPDRQNPMTGGAGTGGLSGARPPLPPAGGPGSRESVAVRSGASPAQARAAGSNGSNGSGQAAQEARGPADRQPPSGPAGRTTGEISAVPHAGATGAASTSLRDSSSPPSLRPASPEPRQPPGPAAPSSPASGPGRGNAADGGGAEPGRQTQEEPAQPASAADEIRHTGLVLAFHVTPPDAFLLLDGTVIGRATEWNGDKKNRAYTLPGPGSYMLKVKRDGMKLLRIALEARETRGVTPIDIQLQPLPAAQVETADLQTVRVRQAVAFKLKPEVGATVLVDSVAVGTASQFAGRFGHPGEWLSLQPGKHRVTLVPPSYRRQDFAVEVTSTAEKDRERIEVVLVPMSGGD